MKNTNIEDIRIIVKENVVRYDLDEETGKVIEMLFSTVGAKLTSDGEQYGTYIVFNKPTLEVHDVVEAANEIFERLITHWQKHVEGKTNEKQS